MQVLPAAPGKEVVLTDTLGLSFKMSTVGGGFKYVLFSFLFGEDFQFD